MKNARLPLKLGFAKMAGIAHAMGRGRR